MTSWSTVITGLAFGEGPRWHDGDFYVSDIFGGAVWRVPPSGDAEVVLEMPTRPSGLGWLPDGRMLVVSMRDRRVLMVDGDTVTEHADLGSVTGGDCNDMLVDDRGRAYVSNFGFDLLGGEERRATSLVMIDAAGGVHTVADDLMFPNGIALSADGSTLYVAETRGMRIMQYRVDGDGFLSGGRPFATFEQAGPDGIALDAEGAIWVPSPSTAELFRVLPGGEVAQRIDPPAGPVQACALGGPDGRSLFICSTPTHDLEEALSRRPGRVDVTEVEVPAARP